MKYCMITLVMLMSGCSVSDPEPVGPSVMEAVEADNVPESLMDQAQRCKGIIRYEHRRSGNVDQIRFSCAWEVPKAIGWDD